MALSGETVIVCGCGLTTALWLMDVCVPAAYKPLLTGGAAPQALCLTSAAVI